jgi:hypothetical protein
MPALGQRRRFWFLFALSQDLTNRDADSVGTCGGWSWIERYNSRETLSWVHVQNTNAICRLILRHCYSKNVKRTTVTPR